MLGKGIPLGFIVSSTLDEVHFTVFSGGGGGGGNAGVNFQNTILKITS